MDSKKLERLLARLARTQDHEVDCGVCLEWLPRHVDLELEGQDAASLLPQVELHLFQCTVCEDEHRLLRDFLREEGSGVGN